VVNSWDPVAYEWTNYKVKYDFFFEGLSMSWNCEIGISNRKQGNEFKVAQYFVLLYAARSYLLEIMLNRYAEGNPTRCLLGTFAKLRQATVSFVTHIRPSA
jgi:hypothetical protein